MPRRTLITRYQDDLSLFPDRWHVVGWLVCAPLALLYPFLASDAWLTVGNLALVAVVGSVSLMILTGFAGQISLGHAAFMALGAYTTAVLGNRLHLPAFVLLPMAGAVAAAVGLAVGVFALRLEGLYLAIVTLGLIFLVNHALLSFPEHTQGLTGIAVPVHTWFGGDDAARARGSIHDPVTVLGLTLTFERKLYLAFLGLAALVTYLAKNLQRSATGRALMAVRDRDLAAAALGVSPARAKILAFGISSFLAGVAGGMFALQQQYITVDPPFNLYLSVQYIAMIVLGGLGTVFGAVTGALAFTMLQPLLEEVGALLPFLSGLTRAQQATVLFSLLVILVLAFEPLGITGVWLRVKRYFAAWPFRY
jgi:branched-chain amino acid transport system permease protein